MHHETSESVDEVFHVFDLLNYNSAFCFFLVADQSNYRTLTRPKGTEEERRTADASRQMRESEISRFRDFSGSIPVEDSRQLSQNNLSKQRKHVDVHISMMRRMFEEREKDDIGESGKLSHLIGLLLLRGRSRETLSIKVSNR